MEQVVDTAHKGGVIMKLYVVIELHSDCPKVRGIFSTKEKAEEVAYKDTEYWRNVFMYELDKEM